MESDKHIMMMTKESLGDPTKMTEKEKLIKSLNSGKTLTDAEKGWNQVIKITFLSLGYIAKI